MADTVVFDGDTELEHYQVVDTIYEGRPARVLYSGQRHTAQSGVAKDDNPDLLFDYNQRFLELTESIEAKRLLLIGGGAFTLPMALLASFPELELDIVEIDAGLQALATRYFGLQPDPRLHIIHASGREYLDANVQKYDVILLDAFSASTMPENLMDPGAVRQMYRSLNANGVLAANIISPYYGPNAKIIQSLYENYRVLFETVDVYPAGRSLFSLWLPQNLVLVAQKGAPFELNLRYGRLPALE